MVLRKTYFYKYCSLHGRITKGSWSPKASVKDDDEEQITEQTMKGKINI